MGLGFGVYPKTPKIAKMHKIHKLAILCILHKMHNMEKIIDTLGDKTVYLGGQNIGVREVKGVEKTFEVLSDGQRTSQ